MEGGGECLSDIDVNEFVNPVDAILASIAIAKDYSEDLKLIHKTAESDLDKIEGRIKAGPMESMRLILAVLQTSHAVNDPLSDSRTYKKYLMKHARGSSTPAAGIRDDDENLEARLKCLQTLECFDENRQLFTKISEGFELLRQLMTDDNEIANDPRWARVTELIRVISECRCRATPPRTKKHLEVYLKWINEKVLDEDGLLLVTE